MTQAFIDNTCTDQTPAWTAPAFTGDPCSRRRGTDITPQTHRKARVPVSVIIPTLDAGRCLASLLESLWGQSRYVDQIVVVDSTSSDHTIRIAREAGCTVKVIPRCSFDHGGSRNLGARIATGDILVFLSQDVMPTNDRFLEELLDPIVNHRASATYARQIAGAEASAIERFTRDFNYPSRSYLRSAPDIQHANLRSYFFSNAASAIEKSKFWDVGGFPVRTIHAEDMFLCARLIRAGHTIGYQANAQIYHTHAYSPIEQFKRYFDKGVAVARAAEMFKDCSARSEGVRFAWGQIRYLIQQRQWHTVPRSVLESLLKALAYRLGQTERRLPHALKQRLSLHKTFWR